VREYECDHYTAPGSYTGVRDTMNWELGALFFAADEWRAFLSSARDDFR
jgi:hypothetical protein